MSNISLPTFYDGFQAREIHLTQFFGDKKYPPPLRNFFTLLKILGFNFAPPPHTPLNF